MSAKRMLSRDTDVRVDDISNPDQPDQHRLVLRDGVNVVVIEGTSNSILMLVDRINDRVYGARA